MVEVPYWAWKEKEQEVRNALSPLLQSVQQARADKSSAKRKLSPQEASVLFNWPYVRDHFHGCHVLVSSDSLTITPILPPVSDTPSYARCKRRIFMSATIGDDTPMIRTFDVARSYRTVSPPGTTGVAERFLCAPAFTPQFKESAHSIALSTAQYVSKEKGLGTVVLTPSKRSANIWDTKATPVEGEDVSKAVSKLQKRTTNGPVIFVNRYDGLDLPQDSCRLLIIWDLPSATNDYELYRAAVLQGGEELAAFTASRLEQGMGRGGRGAGDFCIVLFVGANLVGFLGKRQNLSYFSNPTRVQWELGSKISRGLASPDAFRTAINQVLERDRQWVNAHASVLASQLKDDKGGLTNNQSAERNERSFLEREALDLLWSRQWSTAQEAFEKLASSTDDKYYKAWLLQFAGRAAVWGGKRAETIRLQRDAVRLNPRILGMPEARTYFRLPAPTEQGISIARLLADYDPLASVIADVDSDLTNLNETSSSTNFENSLESLGGFLGFGVQRPERDAGVGPDVLWLSESHSFVLEAKNRKKRESKVAKGDAEQALISSKWFEQQYPTIPYTYAVVAPIADQEADFVDPDCKVMTLANALKLARETKRLYEQIIQDGPSTAEDLATTVSSRLNASSLRPKRISTDYFERLA